MTNTEKKFDERLLYKLQVGVVVCVVPSCGPNNLLTGGG